MAQHDMNIANQSFPDFRTDLNNALSALNTMHSGTNRPSGAAVGTLWLDTTNSGSNSLEIKLIPKMYEKKGFFENFFLSF